MRPPRHRRERIARIEAKRPRVTIEYRPDPEAQRRLVRLLVDLLLEAEAR